MKLIETDKVKIFRSKNYNFSFSKVNGYFQRWGKTKEDDPIMAPSNEILDIEVSTVCNKNCRACYKGNSSAKIGKNMSLETYKQIINKFPNFPSKNDRKVFFLQQVALGIGSVDGNPDLFSIMDYTRSIGIIPNLTINGRNISDSHIKDLVNVCGAIAVSHYSDKECFDTIHRLANAKKSSNATLQQVNIHKIFSKENYDSCVNLINTIGENPKLKEDLNAIVFLSIKPCGPNNTFTTVDSVDYIGNLLTLAQEKGISVGCDSCSAPGVLKWANNTKQDQVIQSVECCEACLTSFYISVDGMAYPCSFAEQHKDWNKSGINMLQVEDFTRDVWFNPTINKWRNLLINSSSGCSSCQVKEHCRSCPIHNITSCKTNKLKII